MNSCGLQLLIQAVSQSFQSISSLHIINFNISHKCRRTFMPGYSHQFLCRKTGEIHIGTERPSTSMRRHHFPFLMNLLYPKISFFANNLYLLFQIGFLAEFFQAFVKLIAGNFGQVIIVFLQYIRYIVYHRNNNRFMDFALFQINRFVGDIYVFRAKC